MKPKLTLPERERLLKRVLNGEKVAVVCRDAGISRVIFYRWLKKYKLLRSLKKLKSLTADPKIIETAVSPKKGTLRKTPHYPLTTRIKAIEEVLAHKKKIASVCRELNISKTIFYRWMKKYQEAGVSYSSSKAEGRVEKLTFENRKFSTQSGEAGLRSNNKIAFDEHQALAALEDKKPVITKYPNQVPEEYEDLILDAVVQYPELSSHKLLHVLPTVGNRPIVGYHGLQNVLRRHNLRTFEQRLYYANQKTKTPMALGWTIRPLLQLLHKLLTLPAQSGRRRIALVGSAAIPLGLFIITSGLVSYIRMFAEAPSFAVGAGYFFSSLALLFGMFFLLYSFKYYMSVLLVLGYSRHALTKEGDTITAREGFQKSAPGLLPDLSHINLKRQPFVSIHLPLYNEKRVVNRLLEAATSMVYENYEVIVCDDSTDETKDIVLEWKNHPRVKISHRESREGYKGGALKEAVRLMDRRTEFVLVFDSDFLPFPDSIEQFLKYFQVAVGSLDKKAYAHSQVAVVQGYQWHVLNKSENWITRGIRSEYAGSYIIERSGEEIYGGIKQIAGSVYMIRADLLSQFGWGTSITEDFELTLRLYKEGYKVVYTPYVQAPSECVSTIKRLIRQRMRWAEGHSHNIKKYFWQMMFGDHQKTPFGVYGDSGMVGITDLSSSFNLTNTDLFVKGSGPEGNRTPGIGLERSIPNQSGPTPISSITNSWIPSQLSISEKLEFLYLAPYYLQSLFFLVGTFFWFVGEAVFQVRLPFWTEIWGWSLILTNLLSLPLMNIVGMFLEESEEKDYLGIPSFVALTYIVAPFQAYAAVKGFLESSEGPWFRTPKTGKITDVFRRGRFNTWLNWIFGKPQATAQSAVYPYALNYRGLSSANNQFNSFSIKPKRMRWISRAVLSILLMLTVSVYHMSYKVSEVYATNPSSIYAIDSAASANINTSWQLTDNSWSTVSSSTKITANKNSGSFQFVPGTDNSTAGTPSTTAPTGNGWIWDTAFGSAGQIADGNWVFNICSGDSDTDGKGGGYLRVLAWKVALTGTPPNQTIASSTNFFDSTTNCNGAAETWTGSGTGTPTNRSCTWNPTGTTFSFDGTEKYLYAELWDVIDDANDDTGDNELFYAGDTGCTTDPNIDTPSVTIPEFALVLIFVVPFIPKIIQWLKKRKTNFYLGELEDQTFIC